MKAEKIIPANYGSIPHLSTSKLTQQADKKVNEGQEIILTKKARDWRDCIWVTEKLDGSNVGVYCDYSRSGDSILFPITRAGYEANTSPHKQHHEFHKWVLSHSEMFLFLKDGWRIVGEWMMQAHGTLYDITGHYPFVALDIINSDNERIPYINFISICYANQIPIVPILHYGHPIKIENAIKLLGSGHYGKTDNPEGVVYRVERDGKFDFAAKWVRADKEDGKYMDQELINKGYFI